MFLRKHIPLEIDIRILSFLDSFSLMQCAQVNTYLRCFLLPASTSITFSSSTTVLSSESTAFAENLWRLALSHNNPPFLRAPLKPKDVSTWEYFALCSVHVSWMKALTCMLHQRCVTCDIGLVLPSPLSADEDDGCHDATPGRPPITIHRFLLQPGNDGGESRRGTVWFSMDCAPALSSPSLCSGLSCSSTTGHRVSQNQTRLSSHSSFDVFFTANGPAPFIRHPRPGQTIPVSWAIVSSPRHLENDTTYFHIAPGHPHTHVRTSTLARTGTQSWNRRMNHPSNVNVSNERHLPEGSLVCERCTIQHMYQLKTFSAWRLKQPRQSRRHGNKVDQQEDGGDEDDDTLAQRHAESIQTDVCDLCARSYFHMMSSQYEQDTLIPTTLCDLFAPSPSNNNINNSNNNTGYLQRRVRDLTRVQTSSATTITTASPHLLAALSPTSMQRLERAKRVYSLASTVTQSGITACGLTRFSWGLILNPALRLPSSSSSPTHSVVCGESSGNSETRHACTESPTWPYAPLVPGMSLCDTCVAAALEAGLVIDTTIPSIQKKYSSHDDDGSGNEDEEDDDGADMMFDTGDDEPELRALDLYGPE